MKLSRFFKILLLSMLLMLAVAPIASAQSPYWMNFYGQIVDGDGDPLSGGEIKVYVGGLLCGSGAVNNDGTYGLLPVYGDDPTTPEKDGASPGDALTFLANGSKVGTAVWSEQGDVQRLNLTWIPQVGGEKVYVVAIVWGHISVPVDLYIAGNLHDTQRTAVNASGEQQATFTLWPENGDTWTVSLVPRVPMGLDSEEWSIEERKGSASIEARVGERPVTYFQILHR